ncbi:MAG: hypothetical protein Q4F74_02535 [Synergistaceae bacterium]|nr:hypothetical protein [Synergistaceae bacterium]
MKKIILLSAAFCLAFASMAFAAQNVKIEEIEYKGNGRVEIDLDDDTVRDPKIIWTKQETAVVRDSKGKIVPADITMKDDDTMLVFIKDIVPLERYNIHVSNINFGSQSQATVVGSFIADPKRKSKGAVPQDTSDRAPAAKINTSLFIGKMEFERGNKLEVDIDDAVGHDNEIRWDGSERVFIKDNNGKTYSARIKKTDKDELDIIISGLARGQKYSIVISGFLYRGSRCSVEGDFTAVNDWKFRDPRHK